MKKKYQRTGETEDGSLDYLAVNQPRFVAVMYRLGTGRWVGVDGEYVSPIQVAAT
jgi:hypothetical protein